MSRSSSSFWISAAIVLLTLCHVGGVLLIKTSRLHSRQLETETRFADVSNRLAEAQQTNADLSQFANSLRRAGKVHNSDTQPALLRTISTSIANALGARTVDIMLHSPAAATSVGLVILPLRARIRLPDDKLTAKVQSLDMARPGLVISKITISASRAPRGTQPALSETTEMLVEGFLLVQEGGSKP